MQSKLQEKLSKSKVVKAHGQTHLSGIEKDQIEEYKTTNRAQQNKSS